MLSALQRIEEVIPDRDAISRQAYRRSDQFRQGKLSGTEAIECEAEPGDGAGHPYSQSSVSRLGRIGFLVRPEEYVSRCSRRSGFPVIDRRILVAVCDMHQHKAAATDISGLGDGHRQRKADCHRSVHGVAAPLQDVKSDPGRLAVLARNHAVATGRHLGRRNAGTLFDKTLLKSLLGRQSGRPSQPQERYHGENCRSTFLQGVCSLSRGVSSPGLTGRSSNHRGCF